MKLLSICMEKNPGNFETLKEEWNEYKLSNNDVIKLKTVVSDITFELNKYNVEQPNLISTNIIYIISSESGEPAVKVDIEKAEKVRIGIVEARDVWNEYRTKNRTIKIKSFITSIFKVSNMYDKNKKPVYLILTSNVIEDWGV